MRYLDIYKDFATDKIEAIPCRMQTAVGLVDITLPRRRCECKLKTLIAEYDNHLKLKPKRFIYKIFPNPSYSYDMIDWKYTEKTLKRLITFDKPLDLETIIVWHE